MSERFELYALLGVSACKIYKLVQVEILKLGMSELKFHVRIIPRFEGLGSYQF